MNGKEDREGFSRRKFIKGISMAAGSGLINTPLINKLAAQPAPAFKTIKVTQTNADFEREPMIRPFGFKGGYMTECGKRLLNYK